MVKIIPTFSLAVRRVMLVNPLAGVLDEYINKTVIYPQDVTLACKTFEIPPLVQPANLPPEVYKVASNMGAKMTYGRHL